MRVRSAIIAPRLPPFDVPDGHDEKSWLRELTVAGPPAATDRPPRTRRAYRQLEHELAIIAGSGFPDTSWSCTTSCVLQEQRHPVPRKGFGGELCGLLRHRHHQRRSGLATNCCSNVSSRPSATAHRISTWTSNPIAGKRRSSTSTPRYGRKYAAQVANVITYRGKSSVRDMARALGFRPGPAGRVEQTGQPVDGVGSESGTDIPVRSSSWPRRSKGIHGTSVSTPAEW